MNGYPPLQPQSREQSRSFGQTGPLPQPQVMEPAQTPQPLQPQPFPQERTLQQAEEMIREAKRQQMQEVLTRMGVSSIAQEFANMEQLLQDVMGNLQHMQNQLQTQMDAQMRQIAASMQAVKTCIEQFRELENAVLNRRRPSPLH